MGELPRGSRRAVTLLFGFVILLLNLSVLVIDTLLPNKDRFLCFPHVTAGTSSLARAFWP